MALRCRERAPSTTSDSAAPTTALARVCAAGALRLADPFRSGRIGAALGHNRTFRLLFSLCQWLSNFVGAVDEKLRGRTERPVLQGGNSDRSDHRQFDRTRLGFSTSRGRDSRGPMWGDPMTSLVSTFSTTLGRPSVPIGRTQWHRASSV